MGLDYTAAMSHVRKPSKTLPGDPERKRDDAETLTIDQRIWLTVAAIPPGKIATYGDIASRAGLPGAARRVGAALRKLPQGSKVPWHRVINASGQTSLPPGSQGADRQRALLMDEGVMLGSGGKRVLDAYRW